jgi:hypothetical protein
MTSIIKSFTIWEKSLPYPTLPYTFNFQISIKTHGTWYIATNAQYISEMMSTNPVPQTQYS